MRSMIFRKLLAILACVFVGAGVVQADQDETSIRIVDVQGSLVLSSTSEGALILGLVGSITSGMVSDFLNITRNRDVDLMILDSPGGNLDAGIAIAEFVSLREMNTWVGTDASCASACSLIFFAGHERLLEGRLGVHQYQTVAGQADDESAAQERIGRLLELLNSFDTPPMAVEKLAVTKPSCMYWFGPEHAAMVKRGADASLERIEGTLECVDVPETEPAPTASRVPAPAPQTPDVSIREVRRLVQEQLNRLGCSVGAADGLIGPRSRAALERFSEERSIPYNVANFDSRTFFLEISAINARVCAAAPRPVAPNLSGNWSLNARCSYTSTAIQGTFTARRTSQGRYTLLYRNNVGETGSGTIIQNGNRASVTVSWNNGNRTTSHMTLNNAGNRMSGRSNNGCVFEAWR